jgi:hypothetical protein
MSEAVPTEDDVFYALKTRLQNATGFADLFPGGVHAYGQPPGTVFPYLVIMVTEEDPEWTFEEDYFQDFTAEARVIGSRFDTTTPDTGVYKRFLAETLGWSNSDPTAGLVVLNTAKVISSAPLRGTIEVKAGEIQPMDRLIAAARFKLTLQAAIAA